MYVIRLLPSCCYCSDRHFRIAKYRLPFIAYLLTLIAFLPTHSHAVVPLPTVGHWKFDENSGGVASDSINGNNGIWDGGAGDNVWAAGLIGGGSQTNDENAGGNGQEHFTIPSLSQLNGATGMTISIWFNQNVEPNNNTHYNALFMTRFLESSFGGGGENWGVALENTSVPRHIDWRVDGASGTEDDSISGDFGWHHVAFSWNGVLGERKLYFDGALLHNENAPTGTILNGGSWDIGNDTCCGSREFTGTLDELAVWDSALSESVVNEIYTNGLMGINASSESPPLRGDVDLDGDVDFDETDNDMLSDLDIIENNFGLFPTGAFRSDGDLTNDGVVDFADALEWRRGFQLSGGDLSALTQRVPEPTGIGIAGMFGMLILASRAKRLGGSAL